MWLEIYARITARARARHSTATGGGRGQRVSKRKAELAPTAPPPPCSPVAANLDRLAELHTTTGVRRFVDVMPAALSLLHT